MQPQGIVPGLLSSECMIFYIINNVGLDSNLTENFYYCLRCYTLLLVTLVIKAHYSYQGPLYP